MLNKSESKNPTSFEKNPTNNHEENQWMTSKGYVIWAGIITLYLSAVNLYTRTYNDTNKVTEHVKILKISEVDSNSGWSYLIEVQKSNDPKEIEIIETNQKTFETIKQGNWKNSCVDAKIFGYKNLIMSRGIFSFDNPEANFIKNVPCKF